MKYLIASSPAVHFSRHVFSFLLVVVDISENLGAEFRGTWGSEGRRLERGQAARLAEIAGVLDGARRAAASDEPPPEAPAASEASGNAAVLPIFWRHFGN